MAAELQSLLDRIQSDGVDKANAKAAEIIAAAEAKAAAIVAEAKKKSAESAEKAAKDAESMFARSEQALKQASRDILLEVKNSVSDTFERILKADVDKALSEDFLKGMIDKIVTAYAESSDTEEDGIELRVNAGQAAELAEYVRGKFADCAGAGVTVKAASDVGAGIRVMLAGGRVEHDFTSDALMEKLASILRPELFKLISQK